MKVADLLDLLKDLPSHYKVLLRMDDDNDGLWMIEARAISVDNVRLEVIID